MTFLCNMTVLSWEIVRVQLFNLRNTIWHLTRIIPHLIIIKAFHILMISIYKSTMRILPYKMKQFNAFLLNEVKEYMLPH